MNEPSQIARETAEQWIADGKLGFVAKDLLVAFASDVADRALAAQAEQIAALQKVFDKEHLHTCVHHNDAERRQAGCPVCLRAQLTAKNVEIERLNLELVEARKWKEEDPRMLREQIRVADVAYNHLRTQLDTANAAAGEMRHWLWRITQFNRMEGTVTKHEIETVLESTDCGTSLLRELEQLRQQVASYEVYEVKSHNEANDAAKDWCKILGIKRDDWGYWKDFTPHIDQLRKERDELRDKANEEIDQLKKTIHSLRAHLDAALHPASKPA